jgi:hypothetical protein
VFYYRYNFVLIGGRKNKLFSRNVREFHAKLFRHYENVKSVSKFHNLIPVSGIVKALLLHAMQVLRGERKYSSYTFFISALDGSEWSESRSLYPWEKTWKTHWIGGLVGLCVGLDTGAREQILCLC